jgi:hypothetical protein
MVDDPAPDEYCTWLRKLKKFGLITESDYHRELGKLYGYKKCCIDNFVTLVEKNIKCGKYMDLTYGRDECDDLLPTKIHVRCLKCRPKPFNKLTRRISLKDQEIYGNGFFAPYISRIFLFL